MAFLVVEIFALLYAALTAANVDFSDVSSLTFGVVHMVYTDYPHIKIQIGSQTNLNLFPLIKMYQACNQKIAGLEKGLF
jgi:hypothetical protein